MEDTAAEKKRLLVVWWVIKKHEATSHLSVCARWRWLPIQLLFFTQPDATAAPFLVEIQSNTQRAPPMARFLPPAGIEWLYLTKPLPRSRYMFFFPLSSSKSPSTTNPTHLFSFNFFLFSCCSASRSQILGLRAPTTSPALSHHLPWGIFPSRRVKLASFFDLVVLLSAEEIWGVGVGVMAGGFGVLPLLILYSLFLGILGVEHQPNRPTERISGEIWIKKFDFCLFILGIALVWD